MVDFPTKISTFCFVAVILREFPVAHFIEALHYKAKDSGSIAGGVITIFL